MATNTTRDPPRPRAVPHVEDSLGHCAGAIRARRAAAHQRRLVPSMRLVTGRRHASFWRAAGRAVFGSGLSIRVDAGTVAFQVRSRCSCSRRECDTRANTVRWRWCDPRGCRAPRGHATAVLAHAADQPSPRCCRRHARNRVGEVPAGACPRCRRRNRIGIPVLAVIVSCSW